MKSFVLAALTIGSAIAFPNAFSDSTTCYTTLASTSCAYQTFWTTKTTACTVTSTSVVKTTTTPAAVTKTSTVTVISTVEAAPNTVTSTKTIGSTVSTTVTTTNSLTATSTSSVTATSTIQPSAGFSPIQDTAPGAHYSGSGGPDPVQKREISIIERSLDSRSIHQYGLTNQGYPKGVSCKRWTHSSACSSSIITRTSTITARAPTSTVIVTTTSTSVIAPSATTTTTRTSTSTSTITSTVNQTSTVTTTQTVTTTYVFEPCATNNLADNYANLNITNAYISSGNTPTLISTNTNTAYDCCLAAFVEDTVPVLFAFQTGTGICRYYQYDTCPGGQATDQFTLVLVRGGSRNLTVGNGYCGEVTGANMLP